MTAGGRYHTVIADRQAVQHISHLETLHRNCAVCDQAVDSDHADWVLGGTTYHCQCALNVHWSLQCIFCMDIEQSCINISQLVLSCSA